MKNFEDDFNIDFEDEDENINDYETDYPENYMPDEDEDEMFQKHLRMKNLKKNLSPNPISSGKWKEEKPYSPIKPSDLPLDKYLKMKNTKTIKMKESDLNRIVKKVLREQMEEPANYMFFSNLEQIKRQCERLLELDPHMIDDILNNGHDWADDHVTEAKTNMDQVFDFMMNETKKQKQYIDFEEMNEGIEITEKKKKNTPTNPSLWSKSLSWAKSRYKVCPSAYCNGAAAKHYKSLGGKWKKK
jgi:hypothetical protein